MCWYHLFHHNEQDRPIHQATSDCIEQWSHRRSSTVFSMHGILGRFDRLSLLRTRELLASIAQHALWPNDIRVRVVSNVVHTLRNLLDPRWQDATFVFNLICYYENGWSAKEKDQRRNSFNKNETASHPLRGKWIASCFCPRRTILRKTEVSVIFIDCSFATKRLRTEWRW